MANEYSHIPNNHLADALISKIKGVANSKSYAQITSASWSVSEKESSESSELDPTPSGGYGFEIESATAIISQGTTTVTIEVNYGEGQSMSPYHINIFKDAEKTQSLVDKGGEGRYIYAELDFMSGLSVGDTIYYDLVREDGSYDTYSGSIVVGPTPDQDPLPNKLQVVHPSGSNGYFVIYGMENAGVSVTYNGEEIVSGTIDTAGVNPDTQEPTGEYYYLNANVIDMPAVGETVTVTVTMREYADWSTTATVTTGK